MDYRQSAFQPFKRKFGMKKTIYLIIGIIITGIFSFSGKLLAESEIQTSMVKIYTTYTRPNYHNPWNTETPKLISGSGCIIKGNRILTNAHVVSDQTFIQVRKYGQSEKYKAKVLALSHEVDLALLTVEEKKFFKEVKPLALGELPLAQEEVVVYGFPEGGDSLSLTKGVISRIEHQVYAHSAIKFLSIQIDAAINCGNSGGPVLNDDKIIGVAMQSLSDSENIGYIVPTPIIDHFLKDLEDGQYDGFPKVGIITQSMENEDLRNMYRLKKSDSGILVSSVIVGSPAEGIIRLGDVITSIEGHDIANDGTVEFRHNARTNYSYFIQKHQIGKKASLKIIRDGKEQEVQITLDASTNNLRLVPLYRYDILPTYYIYSGLVFSLLTLDYLEIWGEWTLYAPDDLVMLLHDGRPSVKGEEVINMIKVLPHDVNNGYHDMADCIITEVNGKKVHNLKELIHIVGNDTERKFIKFKTKKDKYIVLDREKAAKAHAEILEIYGVPADRSFDLDI